MKKIFTFIAALACMAGTALAQEDNTQEIAITVSDWSNADNVAEPFYCTMTYADGVYTIEDYLYLGCNLSFKLPSEPKAGAYIKDVTLLGDNLDTESDPGYVYIYDPDMVDEEGYYESPVLYLEGFNGEDLTEWYWPCFYPSYNSYWFDRSKYDAGKKCWYVTFCMDATDDYESGNWTWMAMDFWMYNCGELTFEDSGVDSLGTENAAPAYFNLQGVRVENPKNGIFIRRHGAKAEKVIL